MGVAPVVGVARNVVTTRTVTSCPSPATDVATAAMVPTSPGPRTASISAVSSCVAIATWSSTCRPTALAAASSTMAVAGLDSTGYAPSVGLVGRLGATVSVAGSSTNGVARPSATSTAGTSTVP